MKATSLRSVSAIRARVVGLVAVASTGLGSTAVRAQAVSDPFQTAFAEVTTKSAIYAAALTGLAGVSVVFMIALKYVKKLPRAS